MLGTLTIRNLNGLHLNGNNYSKPEAKRKREGKKKPIYIVKTKIMYLRRHIREGMWCACVHIIRKRPSKRNMSIFFTV